MTLPSKELLSEVFGRKVSDIAIINENTIGYYFYGEPRARSPFWQIPYHEINLYELANLCKQDAIKYNYFISSFVSHCTQGKGEATIQDEHGNKKVFVGDDEPEAVFKAREWLKHNILKDNA